MTGLVGLPPQVRGILYMLGSICFFCVMTISIRPAAEHVHPVVVVFIRNVIGAMILVPWVLRTNPASLKTDRLWLHILRTALILASMCCWFYAVTQIPLAQAQSLGYTAPLFTTVAAALLLGETVRLRRWSAIAVGFAGALVILRPSAEGIDFNALLVVANAMFWATAIITTKLLTRTESPTTIVLYMYLALAPLALIPALFVWSWPTWEALAWIGLVGAVGLAGHICSIRAFALADASALVPFEYLQLPLVGFVAFLVYSEVPDELTVLGAAIIIASTLYIAHRESRTDRVARAVLPAPGLSETPAGVPDQARKARDDA